MHRSLPFILASSTFLTTNVVGQTQTSTSKVAPAIAWQTSWAKAQQIAREKQKPILLYFGASWCGPCHQLEKKSLNQLTVIRASRAFVPFKVDLDSHPELAAQFRVKNPPTLMVLDRNGKILGQLAGFQEAETITNHLAKIASIRS